MSRHYEDVENIEMCNLLEENSVLTCLIDEKNEEIMTMKFNYKNEYIVIIKKIDELEQFISV